MLRNVLSLRLLWIAAIWSIVPAAVLGMLWAPLVYLAIPLFVVLWILLIATAVVYCPWCGRRVGASAVICPRCREFILEE